MPKYSVVRTGDSVMIPLKIVATGPMKVGKTETALRILPRPLVIIDTERGSLIAQRKAALHPDQIAPFDRIPAADTATVLAVLKDIAAGRLVDANGNPYKSIVIDSISTLWAGRQQAGFERALRKARRRNNSGDLIEDDVILTRDDWPAIKRPLNELYDLIQSGKLQQHIWITARGHERGDEEEKKLGSKASSKKSMKDLTAFNVEAEKGLGFIVDAWFEIVSPDGGKTRTFTCVGSRFDELNGLVTKNLTWEMLGPLATLDGKPMADASYDEKIAAELAADDAESRPKTIEDLRAAAAERGITPEQLKQLMADNGIKGFKSADYETYIAHLDQFAGQLR